MTQLELFPPTHKSPKQPKMGQYKPPPTKQIILDVTGEYSPLISKAHHGLAECSLKQFYPYLDLKEALAFAAGSRELRENGELSRELVEYGDVYEIFSEVYRRGFPRINAHNRFIGVGGMPESERKKYEKLNPFHREGLCSRLDNIREEHVDVLREQLLRDANTFVFECQYTEEKRKKGSNHGIVIMNFQNVYPKKGRIVPAYASEIARILSEY